MDEWRGVDRPWNGDSRTEPSVQAWGAGGGEVTVTRDNVLQVAKLCQDEANRMRMSVDDRARQLRSEPALGDPVSADLADVLNERLIEAPDSYIARARQYVANLLATADELVVTAKSYGYTDDDIARALGGNAGQ
ncbi:hypothetical protein [Goodfellowiella coeruleoviolacea]|uniref:PE domain-containing protein n=1 Tax=Goodfellowiella coeruleoviolacea TaxID=334858 RepID=A0AAE3GNL8_9PSEU|nr:hypothetical protein [Goodfellowiella coeruleoviolacea]MCP2169318.1 hypothetical protein [Goodfellowiella coeruleoviolacea]